MHFPKPPEKKPLSLPSKSGLISKLEERELSLRQSFEELAELEKRLREEKEQLETQRLDLETKSRDLVEGELLLKKQKLPRLVAEAAN